MANFKIEARDEGRRFEDFSSTRFDTVAAAVSAIDDFYGPGFTGTEIHVLDVENQIIVWKNYDADPLNCAA